MTMNLYCNSNDSSVKKHYCVSGIRSIFNRRQTLDSSISFQHAVVHLLAIHSRLVIYRFLGKTYCWRLFLEEKRENVASIFGALIFRYLHSVYIKLIIVRECRVDDAMVICSDGCASSTIN